MWYKHQAEMAWTQLLSFDLHIDYHIITSASSPDSGAGCLVMSDDCLSIPIPPAP
jgi:hypothetical protein